MIKISKPIKNKILSISFLTIIALIYCAPALIAPFWGDYDSWSNSLPILHYRNSILNEHSLPFFTNLWYGGRFQWQNPLWSFLYLPATLVWLTTPLDWGARIIFAGHLIFSLVAGRKLASLFIISEVARIAIAITLTAPMLPILLPGHLEMTMSWGWLLLSIYFLLDEERSWLFRGLYSGLCWGVMALAGDNYHVFYAGLLLIPLTLSFKKPTLLFSFMAGASVGLLHLPSVLYLIGYERANPVSSISKYSMNFWGLLNSITIGNAKPNPMGWESWAPVGVPVFFLFMGSLFFDLKRMYGNLTPTLKLQKIALILSCAILSLLATGILYKGHHLFDTFRVPARAVSLISVIITLYVLMGFSTSRFNGLGYSGKLLLYLQSHYLKPTRNGIISKTTLSKPKQETILNWILIVSVLQICILACYIFRPLGSMHSPYDLKAQNMAILLKNEQAKSVWLSTISKHTSDMYIHVVLTQYEIALPNAYYGDMGQIITMSGQYCGYSFDYLITPYSKKDEKIKNEKGIELVNDVSNKTLGWIPLANLQRIDQLKLGTQRYDIYRVLCNR